MSDVNDSDFDGIILFILGAVVSALVILGFITAVKNSFYKYPKKPESSKFIKDGATEKTQSEKMAEIQRQQKILMQNQRQKLRDMQRQQRRR